MQGLNCREREMFERLSGTVSTGLKRRIYFHTKKKSWQLESRLRMPTRKGSLIVEEKDVDWSGGDARNDVFHVLYLGERAVVRKLLDWRQISPLARAGGGTLLSFA